jgi:hypothetical protein
MEDQPVGRLLRELPRERASDGFTARVLNRLDHPDDGAPARRAPARLRWAAVTAAALLLSIGSFLEWRDQRQTAALLEDATEARQLLEELRVEHDRLSRDLRSLEDPDAPEVIYLGGDETMDLVVDLGRVRESEGETTVPVAYHEQTF